MPPSTTYVIQLVACVVTAIGAFGIIAKTNGQTMRRIRTVHVLIFWGAVLKPLSPWLYGDSWPNWIDVGLMIALATYETTIRPSWANGVPAPYLLHRREGEA